MAELNIARTQELLGEFRFGDLFIEILGWSQPASPAKSTHKAKDTAYHRRMIAELSGVAVFECWADVGLLDRKARDTIQRDIAKEHHENIVIVLDRPNGPTQSFWCWARLEEGKRALREHSYFRGQPTDLFIGKIHGLLVELSELDAEGKIPIVEVTRRLKAALDVEQTTKRFFRDYEEQHSEFLELIEGIRDERDRRWYASILLNRLMFIWFLQKKGFLDKQNRDYLLDNLKASVGRGKNQFFRGFLRRLFFEGFAKPPAEREDHEGWLGEIPYLNGGLFLPHRLEVDKSGRISEALQVPDKAFAKLFALFGKYTWHLDDTPGGKADEINPGVLGYIFEKYINQKHFGAYYTRPEITEYLCERTLHALILDRVRQPAVPALRLPEVSYDSVPELLSRMDGPLAVKLVKEILPSLKLLDPAVGSGAFLVAAMKALINVYAAVLGKADVLNTPTLTQWKGKLAGEHKNLGYGLKRQIITDNLYGVDIMQEACEIARLRLFLALVASARTRDELEPLPNIDFNIQPGNSVVGLTRVDGAAFDDLHGRQGSLFQKSYRELVAEKERAVESYRHAATYGADLRALRGDIEAQAREANAVLNEVLRGQMDRAGVKFEQAAWNVAENKESKPIKRRLTPDDVAALQPFNWGYEFHDILARGGFDVIITNPPWETVKPQAKEFFEDHSGLVTKKKMTIKEFEKEQARLLRDPEIRSAWLEYLSRFPHASKWFRSTLQYRHQSSVVAGKKTGSDLDLYKLFTEQSYNLLRDGGYCGLLTPGSIYTDLGAKGLRELLIGNTDWQCLFGLSNERYIFDGVHHDKKICITSFKKGGVTSAITVAFRINPREAIRPDRLASFLHDEGEHLALSVESIRSLAPDSLAIMEFKSAAEVGIATKVLRWPPLGTTQDNTWSLRLTTEFHMTNDSHLYKTKAGAGRLPLCEGKMFDQFTVEAAVPKYWLEESQARSALMPARLKRSRRAFEQAGLAPDSNGLLLDYESYRLAFRDVAKNTNERTFIATVLPPRLFCPHTASLEAVYEEHWDGSKLVRNRTLLQHRDRLYLVGLFNSFVVDYLIRQRVTAHLSFFHVMNLPVPRLADDDPRLNAIIARAGRLICNAREFDELAKSVNLAGHQEGAADPVVRALLRAELDGLVAHLYELTEGEFIHILSTFPLVEEGVKEAALTAYRALAPKSRDQEASALIAAGESHGVEFKSTARWNLNTKQVDKTMEQIIVRAVAAFLNSEGGNLFIGVDDSGAVRGLADDLKTLGKKPDRDGFENWLTTQILETFGKDIASRVRLTFPELEGKQVCRVKVSTAARPCFIKEGSAEQLYVRAGNSTRVLNTREAIEYCREHWRK